MSWDWSLHLLMSDVQLSIREEQRRLPTPNTSPHRAAHPLQSNPCYHKTGLSHFSSQAGKIILSKMFWALEIIKSAAAKTSSLIAFNPVVCWVNRHVSWGKPQPPRSVCEFPSPTKMLETQARTCKRTCITVVLAVGGMTCRAAGVNSAPESDLWTQKASR